VADPSPGEVRLDIDAGVATLTLHNPEVRNALSETMARQLLVMCDEIDADLSVGAVIVQGSGTTFCSGADTRVLLSANSARQPPSPLDRSIYESFLRFGALGPPTIAAVRGAAVGAGLNLAMSADLRIVARDARLIGGFQRIGIHPGGGFFALMARSAGREAAVATGAFGEELSGERAVSTGLAWEAVEPDEVANRAREYALRAAKDPELARVTTRSMRLELGPPLLPWPAAVELERGPQLWSRQRLPERSAP
jgi:enoyl-CoA hydratase